MGTEEEPFVRFVLHPSDLSEGSEAAFSHALAIALHNHARLTLFHAARDGGAGEWAPFPDIRKTLSEWRALPAGTDVESAVDELSLDVRKVQATGKRPFSAILDYIAEEDVDLVVLTTEGRVGLSRLLQPSLAERMTGRSRAMTLVVPKRARPFVGDDGRVKLRRLLVPVAPDPDPRRAVAAAAGAARSMSKGSVEIYLLHVGREAQDLELPSLPGCSFRQMTALGDVVETIGEMAEAHDIDLIVMATEGRRDLMDALRGSVTERVVRRSRCSVLAVPARDA